MKTRAASTRRARSDGKGKKEEGEGKNTQRSTLNAQRSTATGNLKPQPAPVQGEVLPVPLAEIGPSPFQTRAAETEEELEGLAGIFGLDEADIAAKIAEAGAADGDD